MMGKYTINNTEFNTKNEIVIKCRGIIEQYMNRDVTGNDLDFILEIFKFHPNHDTKLSDMKRICVGKDPYNKNNCFYIENIKGKLTDISWTKCVNSIPFGEDNQMDYIIPFGKYKGQSIYNVFDDDKQYFVWLTTKAQINREMKVKVNQMIKYGYIPFNPMAERFSKNKSFK